MARLLVVSLFLAPWMVAVFPVRAEKTEFAFFEKHIRPVLVERCYECHSTESGKSKGGLRLDTRDGWARGGDSGPALVPGKPADSLLLGALAHDPDLPEMPPKERLPDEVIAHFRAWIADGAPDPRTAPPAAADGGKTGIDVEEGRRFWAFQPRVVSPPPPVKRPDWPRGEIDRFLLASMEENGLSPAPPADPIALARRLTFDLTGLPPTPEEIDRFVTEAGGDFDAAADALVDRLLESPRFGEKWARHWLDLARYADSNGGDINLTFPHAWRYRDYTIDAFNRDKPFDRFIREQIAGDLLPHASLARQTEQMIATGFLIIGPKMLSERDKEKMHLDIADEQIDTIGRAFLGMTLGCARCHDHKFDPVPTEDYYALAGILRSTVTGDGIRMNNVNVSGWIERELPVPNAQRAMIDRHRREIEALAEKISTTKSRIATLEKSGAPLGIVVDDTEAEKRGEWKTSTNFPRFFGAGYLHDLNTGKGEKSVTWRATIPADGEYEIRVSYVAASDRAGTAPYRVRHAGGETRVAVDQTQKGEIDGQWAVLGRFPFKQGMVADLTLFNAATSGFVMADAARFVSVAELEKEPSGGSETLDAERENLTRLEDEMRRLEASAPEVPKAMAAADRAPEEVGDQAIRLRGEPANLGSVVPRGFLQVASRPGGARPAAIPAGESGRRELADWIASPENPLTARVTVNRLWRQVFGEGLVRSVDNFGVLGDRPSHPELLDWLAEDFVAHGWSVKHTLRRLLRSRAYRQSAANPDAARADPENRWLARQNRRALPAESIRDAMLAASGELDLSPPGSSVSHLDEQAIANTAKQRESAQSDSDRHRSLYLPLVRGDMPAFLEIFDMANPDMSAGQRAATTVPSQALLMLNSPLVHDLATALAERTAGALNATEGRVDPDAAIAVFYRRVLGRTPGDYELSNARAYLAELEAEEAMSETEALASLARVLFGSTEFRFLE
ncbi:MAG: DUF1553 domain-containing protein [Akkermansiaceae bacterium]|nr:DUF1553 domain-containing protein [Akkermansiaceae bacterium]MCP5551877.1 DUF1553 domain-containing protein [Akkermansiaceae bacterium]